MKAYEAAQPAVSECVHQEKNHWSLSETHLAMSITGKMPSSLPSPCKSNLGRPPRKETVFPTRKNCDRLTSGGKRDTRRVGRGCSQDPEVKSLVHVNFRGLVRSATKSKVVRPRHSSIAMQNQSYLFFSLFFWQKEVFFKKELKKKKKNLSR